MNTQSHHSAILNYIFIALALISAIALGVLVTL